jgi:serine/threonine-protein kinase RsbW
MQIRSAGNHPRTSTITRAVDSDVRLSMPARPENVAVVRHVIGALAESLGLSARAVEDIRLAVTEACTNVVRHAYRDVEGPLEVTIHHSETMLTIAVADHGPGIRPDPTSDGPGLGLPLIAALSDALVIEHSVSGSRLAMSFVAQPLLETA